MRSNRVNFLRNKKRLKKPKAARAFQMPKVPELPSLPTMPSLPSLPAKGQIAQGLGMFLIISGFAYLVQEKAMLRLGVELITSQYQSSAQANAKFRDHPGGESLSVAKSAIYQEPAKVEEKQELKSENIDTSVVTAPAMADNLPAWAKELEGKKLPGVASLEKDEEGDAVKITIQTDGFFQIGTAKLMDDRKTVFEEIAKTLRGSEIEVEGHTDDSPIVRQKHLYHSNWELSAARAASLVSVFEETGFKKDHLKLVGYGDTKPAFPNRNPAGEMILKNAAKNRRIVLRVSL